MRPQSGAERQTMVFCNTAQMARDLAARLRLLGAARTLEFHSLLPAAGTLTCPDLTTRMT